MKLLFFSLILFCSCNILFAQFEDFNLDKPAAVGMSKDTLDVMDAHFHSMVDNGQLAGIQTAIFRKGKLIHFNSYGHASKEEEILLDEQSIFRIFSMTKPIVSVALMQFLEKGTIKLEDPISKYLPSFKSMKAFSENENIADAHEIKIVDLLRHTSGIGYGRGPVDSLNQLYRQANVMGGANAQEFLASLSSLPLTFQPGSDWEYGFSTNVIGHLVEELSGQSLLDYLTENIFKPLGMKDTHFSLPAEKVQHFTTGYRVDSDGELAIAEVRDQNRYLNDPSFYNGGGGLVSTTLDYLKFCRMLLNNGAYKSHQILKKETIELMTKNHLAVIQKHNPAMNLPRGATGFGLGFSIYEDDQYFNYGWGGAVGTYFRISPEEELIGILMVQISPYQPLNLRQVFQNYMHHAIE